MRSLLEVNTEVVTLAEEISEGGLKPAQVSRKKNRIEFLKLVRNYLESNPKEQYIELGIERIQEKIVVLSNRFNREDYKDATDAFKKYEVTSGITQLRKQLKTLRYIKK